ncbi:hypothetical protein FQN57_000631 [Myotisia sp. PD_48]|nr:hypothetical protein FQN57_000631 [Myotisia sp. PD_48]
MASENTIKIGYVPGMIALPVLYQLEILSLTISWTEHYLAPLHLAFRNQEASSLPFKAILIPFPSGTGHMITSLRQKEIDIAIGLTEGWVAGLVGKEQTNSPDQDGGYKVVGQWVETSLRWAIVTGRNRDEIQKVSDLNGSRVGVSRLGSGSHIMSFVLAQQQNWPSTSPLTPAILGPFPSLRDGVTGQISGANGKPSADFFMWEQFTTKPYFEPTPSSPSPPLKKIGEIFTPWPSWHIVASTSMFPSPDTDDRLAQLFKVLDSGIVAFQEQTEQVIQQLGTGEFGCTYSEADAKEWLKDVRFVKTSRGVDSSITENVINVLKTAGVISLEMDNKQALQKVIGPDPTHGFVKYIGENEARSTGLIEIETRYDGKEVVRMGVDNINITPDGRPSVRISSKKSYNYGLWIADFAHVPGAACGSWPAYWLLGPSWPNNGEIDIFEGINLDISNSMTLHTGQNCTISSDAKFTGTMKTPYCDQNAPPPQGGNGCTILADDPSSFNSGMNYVGGGVYATEWTPDDIKIWYFPRVGGIPSDIETGHPDPFSWGTPVGLFTGNCSFDKSFRDMQIIFDITFCGDWAGSPKVWGDSTCSAITEKCATFVENSPSAFLETYWAINSLRFGDSDETDTDLSIDGDSLPFPKPITRESFLTDNFDAASYLASLTNRHQSLSDLQTELRQLSESLNKELLDLVNENYQEFLSLGTALNGGEDKVEEARTGLLSFQRNIVNLKGRYEIRTRELRTLLNEKKGIRSNIGIGYDLLDIAERIEILETNLLIRGREGQSDPAEPNKDPSESDEELYESILESDSDDGDDGVYLTNGTGDTAAANSSGISLRRLESHIEQLLALNTIIGRVGEHHPFITQQHDRIQAIKSALNLDLNSALKQANNTRSKRANRLVSILRLYDMMGNSGEAILSLKQLKV